MEQHQTQVIHQDLSSKSEHVQYMRWVVLVALILLFAGSLVVIAITQNPFLISLPGSLLLAMRPIIRYLFPSEQHTKDRPH